MTVEVCNQEPCKKQEIGSVREAIVLDHPILRVPAALYRPIGVGFPGVSKQKQQNREQQISFISRNLKALAKELDIPIICLSQLSRAVESRGNKRPMLSDLRESGAIEQDANKVLFIYRDGYYSKNNDTTTEIIVAKNRAGSTGTTMLDFKGATSKFNNEDFKPF